MRANASSNPLTAVVPPHPQPAKEYMGTALGIPKCVPRTTPLLPLMQWPGCDGRFGGRFLHALLFQLLLIRRWRRKNGSKKGYSGQRSAAQSQDR
jgi:hypothetical protein